MTPEGHVKAKVVALLKRYNIWYFYPFSFGAGTSGIPDIIACVRGRFVGIEVKANAKAKLTALQRRRADEIEKAGGVWLRVHDDETLWVLEALVQGEWS
jgi:hypothetical protein